MLFIGPAVFRSPAASPTQYTTDGVPTGLEEEIRWKVNRGRFDTAGENQLRGTAYSDVSASAGPLADCRVTSSTPVSGSLLRS